MPIDKTVLAGIVERLRVRLASDGGGLRVVAVDEGTLELAITGACRHCPNVEMTFRYGVVPEIRRVFPGIAEIKANGMVDLIHSNTP